MTSASDRRRKSTTEKELKVSRRKLGLLKYFTACKPKPKMTSQLNFTVGVSDNETAVAMEQRFLGAYRALTHGLDAETTVLARKKRGERSSSVDGKGKGKATTSKPSRSQSGGVSGTQQHQLSIRTNTHGSTQISPKKTRPAQPAYDDDSFPWATFEDITKSSSAALGCFVVGNPRFRGNIADLPIPEQAVQSTLAVQFRVVDSTANVRKDENQPEFMVFCSGHDLEDVLESLAPDASGKSALVHRADEREEGTADLTALMSEGRKFWVEIVENNDSASSSA